MARFIVVTGLPASGKTTIGRAVAAALQLPLIDKDALLEAMFDAAGTIDSRSRAALSRAADQSMQRIAQASDGAVLVSWWRHPASETDFGTSTEWLQALPGEVTEIHCRCTPAVAIDRFFSRRRHPGHLDHQRIRALELEKFTRAAALGAIGAGRLIDVCTEQPFDVHKLVGQLTS